MKMNRDEDTALLLTSGGRARSLGFITIIVVSSSSVSMNSARPCRSEEEKRRKGREG